MMGNINVLIKYTEALTESMFYYNYDLGEVYKKKKKIKDRTHRCSR